MTTQEIEKEIRRLAPWYYAFDLRGVNTNITPAFDHWGHRQVDVPQEIRSWLRGRTILDVGCNEGAYAFAAARCGAKSVLGIDCRPENIEKADFVAHVLEVKNAAFQVGSADAWSPTEAYDVVFLCGLLYHLPEPWDTIRKYCEVAQEGIFVVTMLHKGRSHGYSQWVEGDSIGASEDPTIPSMSPNTVETVVAEFGKHSFVPKYVMEFKFLDPSSFTFLGPHLVRKLNRARERLLKRADPLLKRFRGHPSIHVTVSAGGAFSGSVALFFRRASKAA